MCCGGETAPWRNHRQREPAHDAPRFAYSHQQQHDPARESSESGSIGATMRVHACVRACLGAGARPCLERCSTTTRWHGCSRAAAHRFRGHPCDHVKVAARPLLAQLAPAAACPIRLPSAAAGSQAAPGNARSTESEIVFRATMPTDVHQAVRVRVDRAGSRGGGGGGSRTLPWTLLSADEGCIAAGFSQHRIRS